MARAARIRSQLALEVQETPTDVQIAAANAATIQLPGLITMRHTPNRVVREEYRNSWGGSNTPDDLRLESTGQYVGRCTTSTLIYWLSAAMRNNPTISAISGGSQWVFNQPLTQAPIPPLQAYRVYTGDDDGAGGGGGNAMMAPGVVVSRIVIEGADDAAWTVRCDLIGMGLLAGTFTTGLTTIANETVKNLLSSITFSADWATLVAAGPASATPNLGYGFTWTYDAGIAADFTMSTNLRRTTLHRAIPETTLQLRMKWTTEAASLAVAMVNNSRKFIRLLNTGTGPHFIDIAGSYTPMGFDMITDQRDGTTRSTADYVAVEDPAAGTARKVEVKVGTAAGALVRTLKHTIGCRIAGFESLDITVNIGLTNDEIAEGQARGEHLFVMDFPNWDEQAEALELCSEAPCIPLTSKELLRQPGVLGRYISGGYVITDAIEDYLEFSRPNHSRR